jgi:hypothetical protein
VGVLLQEIFQVALELDWQSHKLRRSDSPLPPLAVSLGNLPVIERILPKQISEDDTETLELQVTQADPAQMDAEFWNAYHALNRTELFLRTLEHLQASGDRRTIGQLATSLPPSHDLETLAFWLAMAREAGIALEDVPEIVDLADDKEQVTRFKIPSVKLGYEEVKQLRVESLE